MIVSELFNHPSLFHLCLKSRFETPYLVFHEKVKTSRVFVREVINCTALIGLDNFGSGEHGANVPPSSLWGHSHGGVDAQGAVCAQLGGGVDEVHH